MEGRKPRIALMGVYSGLVREYNPGCVLIFQKTVHELKKRIDGTYDGYAYDVVAEHEEIQREEIQGIPLNIFSRNPACLARVEQELLTYDAVVIGGDVIWGGPMLLIGIPFPTQQLFLDTFLLHAFPALMASPVRVAFNVVHSYDLVDPNRPVPEADRAKFMAACRKASYVSVRTPHIKQALDGYGLAGIHHVPDPILDMNAADLEPYPVDPRVSAIIDEVKRSKKRTLGISLAPSRARYMIHALKNTDLSEYDVWVYPYSRYYHNIESVFLMKHALGSRFRYLDIYPDPFDAFKLVGAFDVNMNDTFHGVIGSLVQGKAFITMEHDNQSARGTSKKATMLDLFGLTHTMIGLPFDSGGPRVDDRQYRENVAQLASQVTALLRSPPRAEPAALANVKARVQRHFDTMAAAIQGNA